jgi:hypothetical protein
MRPHRRIISPKGQRLKYPFSRIISTIPSDVPYIMPIIIDIITGSINEV